MCVISYYCLITILWIISGGIFFQEYIITKIFGISYYALVLANGFFGLLYGYKIIHISKKNKMTDSKMNILLIKVRNTSILAGILSVILVIMFIIVYFVGTSPFILQPAGFIFWFFFFTTAEIICVTGCVNIITNFKVKNLLNRENWIKSTQQI